MRRRTNAGIGEGPWARRTRVERCPSRRPRRRRVAWPGSGAIALTIAFSALVSAPSRAQGPAIEVSENGHDFGDIWINDRVAHTFKIRNTGDAELELLDALTDCPCITFSRFDRRIAPGKTGDVRVELDTSNYIYGRFAKRISVLTNVPSKPTIELTFKGVIREYVARSPVGVGIERLDPSQSAERVVKLTNATADAITLALDSPPLTGCFSVQLVEDVQGQQWSLHVTAAPPFQAYMNETTVRLASSVPQQPIVSVHCTAYVPPRLELRPYVLIAQPAMTVREVRFINNDPDPVRVLSVSTDDPRLRADVVQGEDGRKYTVRVVMPLAYAPPDAGNVITINTDDVGEPRIELRLVSRKAADNPSSENPEP